MIVRLTYGVSTGAAGTDNDHDARAACVSLRRAVLPSSESYGDSDSARSHGPGTVLSAAVSLRPRPRPLQAQAGGL